MNLQGRSNGALKSVNGSIKLVLSIDVEIQGKFNIIQPRFHLHKIANSKKYYKSYGRDPNMAAMFRRLLEEENAQLSTDATCTFLKFPEHCEEEGFNDDAKQIAYGQVCLLLTSRFEGKKSWNEISGV